MTEPPADPSVRAFLDEIAQILAESLLRDPPVEATCEDTAPADGRPG